MSTSINAKEVVRIGDNLSDTALLERGLRPSLVEASSMMERYAKGEAPRQTGRLARATSCVPSNTALAAELGTDLVSAPHARYVLEGTKAHVIEPKNAQALRFLGGFYKKAYIPARAAKNYLQETWRRHENEFALELEKGEEATIQGALTT